MRSRAHLLLAIAMAAISAPAALADIPVRDDDVQEKRAEDEGHSRKDTETQGHRLKGQTVTNCNISRKEKNRRLYRSPAQAVKEDAGNVALIRHCHQLARDTGLAVDEFESGLTGRSLATEVPVDVREYVYFIRYRDRMKIGTTTNVRKRLAGLPMDELLAVIPGGR